MSLSQLGSAERAQSVLLPEQTPSPVGRIPPPSPAAELSAVSHLPGKLVAISEEPESGCAQDAAAHSRLCFCG